MATSRTYLEFTPAATGCMRLHVIAPQNDQPRGR
jgi:hypothetical protein